MLNRDVRAPRQAVPQAKLRHIPTARAGGWTRQRRRRETEGRRAERKRIELTLRDDFCFSDQNRKCEEHVLTGEKGNRVEGSGNESTCKGAGRLG